jgi:hypothetical protein
MAIKKTLKLIDSFGDEQNVVCYVRLNEFRSTKTNAVANFDIFKFGNTKVIKTHDVVFDHDVSQASPNAWTQAYNVLKLEPEFIGAEDC